jgi:ribonucleotide monophosphatase NagD (HAD superfamily)
MTDPDFVYAEKWPHMRYGAESLTIMVEALFKRHYGYDLIVQRFGKPFKATFNYAEKILKQKAASQGTSISNFYMIGDNPETDIAGGNTKGWTTILVKSGVFKADGKTANDKTHPATFVVDDFKKAIDLIFSLENIKN